MEEISQLVRLQLLSGPALARPRCTCRAHPRERRMEREGEEGTQAARSLSMSSWTALEALVWDVLAYPFLSPPGRELSWKEFWYHGLRIQGWAARDKEIPLGRSCYTWSTYGGGDSRVLVLT